MQALGLDCILPPLRPRFSFSPNPSLPPTPTSIIGLNSSFPCGFPKPLHTAPRCGWKSSSRGVHCAAKNAESDDAFYIRRCVELARKAVGFTSPNPLVGCVIVKDGNVVGQGFHPKAGQPHAEVPFSLYYFILKRERERKKN